MEFDAGAFLVDLAAAYNERDPDRLRTFYALEDPRFALFEDFTAALLDGPTYGAVLEGAFDAPGTMAFAVLRCDRFGDVAVVHALQRIAVSDPEEGIAETPVRTTLAVLLADGAPRIVAGHFSLVPEEEGQAPMS